MPYPKVLIVEDEAIVADTLALDLEKLGYTVIQVVASGEEALTYLETTATVAQHPDLVLMDIWLQGGLDGIQTAQQLRRYLDVPVVYLTANADRTTLERATATLPFGYVVKPYKEVELQATLAIALSRHRTEVAIQQALKAATTLPVEQLTQDAKSQYLSMASHEFRTPLSVIQFSSTFLQDYNTQLSEDKKLQHLQRIQWAAETLNALLDDVMSLSKMESGQLQCSPTPLDLVDFCQNLLETLRWGGTCQHLINFSPQATCQAVCLDEKLLWHMLNNLLSNAMKYSPIGSTITLRLDCTGTEVCFQVQDQGIGIPLENQPRLFEPFYRAANVGQIAGTGLGLAIVKRSIDLHQGQIYVDSEIGRGTTITIRLPKQLSL